MNSIRLGREHPPLVPWTGSNISKANFQANTTFQSLNHPGPCAFSNAFSPAAPFALFGRPLAPQIQAPMQGFASLGGGSPTTMYKPPTLIASQAQSSLTTRQRQPQQSKNQPSGSFHTPASSFKSTPLASTPMASASTSQSVSRASRSGQAASFKSAAFTSASFSAQTSNPMPRASISGKAAPFSCPGGSGSSSLGPSNGQILQQRRLPDAPAIENNVNYQPLSKGGPRSTVLQPSGNSSTPSSKAVAMEVPSTKLPLPQQNTAPPGIATAVTPATGPPQGVKRRLGMGPRAIAGGYANKKFKPPTL